LDNQIKITNKDLRDLDCSSVDSSDSDVQLVNASQQVEGKSPTIVSQEEEKKRPV
jgi:hypothetical protein